MLYVLICEHALVQTLSHIVCVVCVVYCAAHAGNHFLQVCLGMLDTIIMRNIHIKYDKYTSVLVGVL